MVRDAHHDAHVVLDQQDADPLLVADREQQLVELGRFARVEAGGRLVEAQQARPGAQRAGDLEPALVAVGQRAGRPVGARRSARSGRANSGRGRSPPARRCGSAAGPRGRRSRTGSPPSAGCAARRSGFPAPSCRRTGGCSGRCAPCRRAARCGSLPSVRAASTVAVRAMQGQPAGARPVEAGQAVEDGRLAGAVRPDDRGDLAAGRR